MQIFADEIVLAQISQIFADEIVLAQISQIFADEIVLAQISQLRKFTDSLMLGAVLFYRLKYIF